MVEHEKTSWIDSISIGISRVAMFVVAFIVLIMFYEVVMRYVFGKPTLWVTECRCGPPPWFICCPAST